MSKKADDKPATPVKRKRNKEATINRIINKTKKMIKEKGYALTSTNHIAKEAGVSIALIYKYFPSGKPEIVQNITRRSFFFSIINSTSDYDSEIVIGEDPSPELLLEKAKRFLIAYIAYNRQYAFLNNALEIAYLEKKDKLKNKQKFEDSDVINESWDYDDYYKPYYEAVIKVLVIIGITDEVEQIKMSKLLVNTFNSIIRQQINYENLVDTDEELADFLIDLLVGYVNRTFTREDKSIYSSIRQQFENI